MSSGRFKKLTEAGKLAEGSLQAVRVGRKEFLVLRRAGRVYVCSNKCPHQGARLSDGIALGKTIVCPCHHARFDLESGRLLGPPALDDIPVYQVLEREQEVMVGPVREPSTPCPPAPSRRRTRQRFVIVGAGAAGSAAAETLREEGFDGLLVLLNAEPELPYDRTVLSKGFLSGENGTRVLQLRSAEYYRARRIDILRGRRVVSLSPDQRRLILDGGDSLPYDRLLLASGGVPRRLHLPGEQLRGCFYLRSKADAEQIALALPSAGSAVILGAGFIGLEAAAALRRRGLSVRVVAPEALPMDGRFGETIGGWLRELHENRGVRFFLGRRAARLEGRGRVEEVVLSDGLRLKTELVIIAAGIRPAAEYLEGTGVLEKGAVPVDDRFRTRKAEIFAAGDLAAVPGPGGKRIRVEHWAEAQRQGRAAALSMLGKPCAPGAPAFFWTEQFGYLLKSVGVGDGEGKYIFRGHPVQGSFLAGFFCRGQLRAALSLGRDRELIAAAELIRRSEAVTEELFRDPNTDLLRLALS
jgi:NADPH-dependent 2,4-dienoyl-CoA reductase/sulfur reductase-like enzyme/nitrite reductase/ring-hydroxylating ferredoxin subunit